MNRRKLNTQLFLTYLVIILLMVFAFRILSLQAMKDFYYKDRENDLKSRAFVISEMLNSEILQNSQKLQLFCKNLGSQGTMRVTIVNYDGLVIADSEQNPEGMDNHKNRPEIIEAMEKGMGSSIRYSNTINTDMMYLAIMLSNQQGFLLRTSIPVDALQTAINVFAEQTLVALFVITFIAAILSYIVSQAIVRPLEQMKEGADRFAGGSLQSKLVIPKLKETASLAETLNKMASQLDSRINTILKQRNEKEAILSSMVEGVIAIDNLGDIATINYAAKDMFDIDGQNLVGKNYIDVIKSPKLIKLLKKLFKSKEVVENEIKLKNELERYVQIHGVRLKGTANEADNGILLVMNDITRLKQLERVRRDFVANVSHELKTPITSIQGYAETLHDEKSNNLGEKSERFLSIITRQSERMRLIIDDLLHLAEIEDMAEKQEMEMLSADLYPIIQSAIQDIITRHGDNINIELSCDPDLTGIVNIQYIRQAIINLLDNAVKYGENSKIFVNTVIKDGSIIIKVKNNGSIIPENQQKRLFERFYRIDKSRSRDMGGTGLGLAIVKHISQAHNGEVIVSSDKTKGTIFSIVIPTEESD